MNTWYAVMADREDSDWGYGSHDLSEAKQMLKDAEYEDGYIAVIENDVCIEELTQDELFEDMFMIHEHRDTRWNKRKGGRMFRNLYAEEARHNQTNITMGKMLKIDPVTYSRKKKNGNFTISEAKKLTEFFGVSFEYLFKVDGETCGNERMR